MGERGGCSFRMRLVSNVERLESIMTLGLWTQGLLTKRASLPQNANANDHGDINARKEDW